MTGFDPWWEGWPKKVAKLDAQKAYAAARRKGYTDEELLRFRDAYISYHKQRGTDKSFLCHAGTFLRGQRWTDEGIMFERDPLPLLIQAQPSWNGARSKLESALGPDGRQYFQAWFSDSEFREGPPPKIIVPSKFKKDYILSKFCAPLMRLWPNITVETLK